MLRTQTARFLQSLSLITWLPVPAWARGARPCVGSFPVVGAALGFLGAVVFILASLYLPASLAVGLAMVTILVLDGASREASLAGSARGAVAAFMIVLLRLVSLLELGEDTVPMALVVALPLGQLAGVAALFALHPPPGPEHAVLTHGLHPQEISHRGRFAAAVFGLAPLLLLPAAEAAGVLGVVAAVAVPTLLVLRARHSAPLPALHITALVVEAAVYLALNLPWMPAVEEMAL